MNFIGNTIQNFTTCIPLDKMASIRRIKIILKSDAVYLTEVFQR